jgi:mono/diheme cytochrome c family protein
MLVLLAGCRQDMHNQPRYKPLRATAFFADGRSARPLVPGTVPRGAVTENTAFYTGMIGSQPVNAMPFPVTRQVLEQGRGRFNIYCAPCHSQTGDGDGMIVRRGYLRPPSLHIERLQTAPLGHFFAVITQGFGGMPDYASQISPEDRWKIVAYVRALQLSQSSSIQELPASERIRLGEPPTGSGALPPPSDGRKP